MGATQELVAAVREATEGTPYVVTETEDGFDMTIDLADAQWWTLIRANGLKRVFTYEVRTYDRSKTLMITDVQNSVRWSGGAGVSGPPSLSAEKTFKRGRVISFSMQKQYGIDARTKTLKKVVDYRFNSNEGRDIIRAAAQEAGWRERMNGEQKGAAIVAGGTVLGGVLAGLFFLGRWLLGLG
ncbi:MAG TPA: hypothetical protein VH915_05950 [Pedococcus sp.]